MIEQIEELLVHWGEQRRRRGLAGTGVSPLAGLMEWKGAPPRGESGHVILLGGAGMDHVASEVDAVIAGIERRGLATDAAVEGNSQCRDTQLAQLAHGRYLAQRSLAEQLKRAGCEKSAYYGRVGQLHKVVEAELLVRAKRLGK